MSADLQAVSDVLAHRLTWASVHWGEIHPDAVTALAKAIVASGVVVPASRVEEAHREGAATALREAWQSYPFAGLGRGWLRSRADAALASPATDAPEGERGALAVCEEIHGPVGNDATVYGHRGSVRSCLRMFGTDVWVYDPRWEKL